MIGVAVVLIVIWVWFDLKLLDYTREMTQIIANIEYQVVTHTDGMNEIKRNGGYMILCALGSLTASISVGYLASRIAAAHAQRLRSLQFSKVDSFSMAEINKFSTASLITRSTNDVTQIQMVFTMGLQIVIRAPILAVWALSKMTGMSMEWTMVTGVAVVVLVVMFAVLILLVLPKFRKMQTLTDNVNQVARENLTGLPVVRAYNADGYQEAKFEKANDELTSTQLYTSRALATMMPLISLVMNMVILAVYWIAAILINNTPANAESLIGDLAVVVPYSMQVLMSFMLLTILFIMLPRAQVSARRINEVLDSESTIIDGNMTETDPSRKGEIEFKNVGFSYPGAANPVLHDISFSVSHGETAAFIGSTGSGKSTLVNLIVRFYDVTEGSVLIDGIDVRDYKLDALHDKIGYVPQKAVLFSGTVTSNVAFGDMETKRTEDDVKDAVRIAQGKDFVEKMDNTYEATISRGGTNVSGGQKQRLSIARAVAKKPEIYVFDDSFSALDYKTDRNLRTVLKKETRGVTSIIVAQRIGTIMDADKIVVLDEGKLVGIGTHKELLNTCAVYRDIATSQLSEKELDL